MLQQEKDKKLFIYHINDLHSSFHNWSKIVNYLHDQRKIHSQKGEEMILVDIGDHIDRSHPITEATMGKGNAKLLEEAGFQYITIGNNEGLTIPKHDLIDLYKNRSFKVLVCNIQSQDDNEHTNMIPYAIHHTNIGDIGIIGATFPYKEAYAKLGWEVRDPIEAIKEVIEILKNKNVKMIVLLSHLGQKWDRQIAETIDDIQLILGAHTHHHFPKGEKIRNTYLGAAYKYGEFVGKVTITEPNSMSLETISVDQLVNENRATQDLLNELRVLSNTRLQEKITNIPRDYENNWYEDNEIAHFFSEALMEWTNTKASAIFSGIFMTPLKKGDVTRKILHEMLPHPINPAVIRLKGKYIKQFFMDANQADFKKKEIKGLGFRGKVLGHLYLAGFTYENKQWYLQEQIVKDDEVYEMAVLDLVTFGPLFSYIRQHAEVTYYLPEVLRDIMEWKLLKEYPNH